MRYFILIFCLLGCMIAAGQTCTGGLGDPIVNVTFGQGLAPGSPLPAGTTNLAYQAADCPNDGYYAIVSHTSSCFGGTWWYLGQDHTGNQAGYFMLINASYQPSDFYVQKVGGLCGGTSYQFAAWIMNMAVRTDQIQPNITFTIQKLDGTVLQSYNTGDIAPGRGALWIQYAFYFNTPPGIDSVVLRMTNNAPGGIGNDLALDDITFRTAGSSVQLSVTGLPTDTIAVCDYAQTALSINATVESCYPSQQLQWQQSTDSGTSWQNIAGQTGTVYNRATTPPGDYEYRLLAAQTGNIGVTTCEVASRPVVVDVIKDPNPAVSIAASLSTICLGLPVTFTATPVDGGSGPAYQWMVNGNPAGTDSSGFTTASLVNGDVVQCQMTSDALCLVNTAPVVSNLISEPAVPVPVTGVSIDASATAVCKDSLVKFTAVPDNGGAQPVYQWKLNGVDVGSGPVFSDAGLNDGDVVNCIMTGSLTCSQPVSAGAGVSMTIYPLPVITLDSAVIIAGGSSVQLTPVVSGDVTTWNWTPETGLSDAFVASPIATPVSTTAYQLYVVTAEGCHSAATEIVEVYYPLQMPKAFTPNGDGRNDIFRVPPAFPVSIQHLAVYNRQGLQVFYSPNVNAGWDGTFNGHAQPAGTYVWELVFLNPLTQKAEKRSGTLILVR